MVDSMEKKVQEQPPKYKLETSPEESLIHESVLNKVLTQFFTPRGVNIDFKPCPYMTSYGPSM